MGWDYVYTTNTRDEEFRRQFVGRDEWAKYLGHKWVGTVCYAAFEQNRDGTVVRFALVVLSDCKSRGQVGFKLISDDMGPLESKCPASILKLLDGWPPVNEYALNWRNRCRENLTKGPAGPIRPGSRWNLAGYGEHLAQVEIIDFKRHLVHPIVDGVVSAARHKLIGLKKEFLTPLEATT